MVMNRNQQKAMFAKMRNTGHIKVGNIVTVNPEVCKLMKITRVDKGKGRPRLLTLRTFTSENNIIIPRRLRGVVRT